MKKLGYLLVVVATESSAAACASAGGDDGADSGSKTTSLVNALFLADQVMTWLENGVTNVDWWTIHNSPFDGNNDASLYGSYAFGDYGILSRGLTSANGAVEPKAETKFPAYYGLEMLSRLGAGQFDGRGIPAGGLEA